MPEMKLPLGEASKENLRIATGGPGYAAEGSGAGGGAGDDSRFFANEAAPIIAGGGSGAAPDDAIKLDLKDPFDQALLVIYQISQRKRADYAAADNRFSNFEFTSWYFGVEDYQSADFNELQKLARLKQLNNSPTAPANEPVLDSYVDKAVYAVLALAMYMRSHQ